MVLVSWEELHWHSKLKYGISRLGIWSSGGMKRQNLKLYKDLAVPAKNSLLK